MRVADQLRTDLTNAMRARDRERVGALRMVLSEVQKAAKDGQADELAVLRRERKRRLEAAGQFRAGGREELAAREESEARLIDSYLPAELSDEELAAIVARAVGDLGATSARDMGRVMGVVMGRVEGRAEGGRVAGAVRELLGA